MSAFSFYNNQYLIIMATKNQKNKRSMKRWSAGEDDRLIENVRNHPTNLKHAFQLTAQEVQRTPGAVASRWYLYVSKNGSTPFLTMSGKHIAANRKNGKGVPTKLSLYKRILAILGLQY